MQRTLGYNILRSKLLRAAIITFFLQQLSAGPVWGYTQEEHSFTIDVTANENWVSGPGAAQSTLATGHPFVGSDFSYNYIRTADDQKFTFRLHGRSTDDQTIDKQTWSLSNFELGWEDTARKIALGDVMADFSAYSMSGAVKGVSVNFKPETGSFATVRQPEISLLYGVSYPRWENFWGGADLKAIKRTVSGVNIKEAVSPKTDIGFSFVKTNDANRLSETDQLFRNNVYSFNWEYRPQEELTFKGESAYSFTKESPSGSDPDQYLHGNAHQFSLSQNSRHQRWSYEYERVTPNFMSLLGSAITDQERMKLRWNCRLNPDLSLNAGLAWSHNNLPGSTQAYRTDMYQPELSFSFIAPFSRETATMDIGLRLDRRVGGGISTADRLITANYRDAFGKIDSDISVDYTFYDTAPYDYGIRNKNLSFNIVLGTSVTKPDYILRPALNVSFTRNMDMLNHYSDRMFEAALGFGYERLPDNFSANFKIGRNQNLKQSGPDSSKWFGNLRIEAQPKYLKMINQNAKQFLEININAYKFDEAGNNYRETSVITGFHFEY